MSCAPRTSTAIQKTKQKKLQMIQKQWHAWWDVFYITMLHSEQNTSLIVLIALDKCCRFISSQLGFIVEAAVLVHYSLQLIELYYLISSLVSLEKDWCCSCCLVMQSTLSEGLRLIYSLTEHISRGRAHLTGSSVNSAYFHDSMMFPPH